MKLKSSSKFTLILEVQLCEDDVSAKRSSELNSPKSYEVKLGEIQHGEVDHVLEVVLDITGGRQTSLLPKSRPPEVRRS